MHTHHAQARAQQRGIPPLVDELLERYGHEQHDGHGAVVLYLDKRSIRAMQRDLGARPVARLAEWLASGADSTLSLQSPVAIRQTVEFARL